MKETAEAAKAALTLPEFCKAYGVSRSFAYREIGDGKLVTRKAGRRTLVLKTDADAWLANLPAGGRVAS